MRGKTFPWDETTTSEMLASFETEVRLCKASSINIRRNVTVYHVGDYENGLL